MVVAAGQERVPGRSEKLRRLNISCVVIQIPSVARGRDLSLARFTMHSAPRCTVIH